MQRPSRASERTLNTIPGWVDALILLVIVIVAIISILAGFQAALQGGSLLNDKLLVWDVLRAAGMSAYTLLGASTLWGLFLSSKVISNWSPGPVSMLLHATLSWLAVILSITHVGLLLFDSYYNYALVNLVIPFTGPYRPFAVGLGVIAFWLTLAITVSFSLRKLIGRRLWLWLHYTSYAAFGLVTVHALLAGTDATNPGMQLIFFYFAVAVVVLLGLRISRARSRAASNQTERP